MAHEDIDDLFREILNSEDLPPLGDASKEKIWGALYINQKRSSYIFWKIAAAFLLLLLAGSIAFQINGIRTHKAEYSSLRESMYLQEHKHLEQRDSLIALVDKYQIQTEVTRQVKLPANIVTNTIVLRDTIYIDRVVKPEPLIVHYRDTVYASGNDGLSYAMEPQVTKDVTIQNTDAEILPTQDQPVGVEFLFGSPDRKRADQVSKNFLIIKSGRFQRNRAEREGTTLVDLK